MNKTELIAAVAEKASISKKDADSAVNAVLDTIVEALAADEKVQLVGFGTFEVRSRSARQGRDPDPTPRSPSRLPRFPLSRPARRSRILSRNKVFKINKGCGRNARKRGGCSSFFIMR